MIFEDFFYQVGTRIASIGRGKKGFNQLGNTFVLGTKGPVWIDVMKPGEMYLTIPQLQTVINRIAAMASNMEIKEVDAKGADITSEDFRNFLKNINPLQGFNEFVEEYFKQKLIYGAQFMRKSRASALQPYPTSVWNIPPEFVQPIMSGKIWDQFRIEDIITGYQYNDGTTVTTFESDSVLYTRIPDPRNPLKGLSPIMALKYPLSNILAGYKYENVIYEEAGGIGLMAPKAQKDAIGAVTMTPEQRLEIEKQYRNDYGIEDNKSKIVFASIPTEFTPMTYPMKDMQIIESRDANFFAIVDHYRANGNIFTSKNSTYENLKNGIVLTYQDCIQPIADDFIQNFDKFIGKRDGVIRVASFEHVPILREAKQTQTLSLSQMVTALNAAVEGKLITKQEAEIVLKNEIQILNV